MSLLPCAAPARRLCRRNRSSNVPFQGSHGCGHVGQDRGNTYRREPSRSGDVRRARVHGGADRPGDHRKPGDPRLQPRLRRDVRLRSRTSCATIPSPSSIPRRGVRNKSATRASRTLREKNRYWDERIMARRDGALFWCRVRGRTFTPDDPLQRAVWSFADLSEQRPCQPLTPRERQIVMHAGRGRHLEGDRAQAATSRTARSSCTARACCASTTPATSPHCSPPSAACPRPERTTNEPRLPSGGTSALPK